MMVDVVRIAYAHDGKSIYDHFFLSHFSKEFEMIFLTFNSNPSVIPKYINTIKMPDVGKPLKVHEIIRSFLLSPFRTLVLDKYVNKIKPDILIGNWIWSYGLYSAFSTYKPFVLFIWGSDILVIPKISPILRGLASYIIRKADLIVVNNDVQVEACINLGVSKKKIIKIPWFDSQEVINFIRKSPGKKKIRDELRVGGEYFLIISTRRHEKIYNIETLIKAAPIIISKIKNSIFLIVGHGKLTEKFKNMVKMMGIKDYFIFTGNQSRENVIKYLKASDVYVSTSLSDGTSASLLEAMSCKVPVIVTDIPGNREWIRDGINGFLFKKKDYMSLADKVVKLLLNKNLRIKFAEEAFKNVINKADWNTNMEKFKKRLTLLN